MMRFSIDWWPVTLAMVVQLMAALLMYIIAEALGVKSEESSV